MSGKRLPYFLFDGNINRRKQTPTFPIKSPEGISDSRETFLKKLKDERTQREIERNQQKNCRRIQAWWRGCLQRKRSKIIIRAEYDESQINYTSGDNPNVLHVQIMWLCQNILKSDLLSKKLLSDRAERKFLTCCLKYLFYISSSNLSLALPLRCIEIYFRRNQTSVYVVKNLINEGYFETFKNLIYNKVPEDLTEETTKPPTPLAESIFDALLYPLSFVSKSNDLFLKVNVYQKFLTVFFDCDLLPAVRFYILPSLCDRKIFKFDEFALAFDENYAKNSKNITFAYAVLYLMSNCPIELQETLINCCRIVARVVQPVLELAYKKNKQENDADESGTEKMDVSDINDDYVADLLKLLNSKIICQILLNCIDSQEFSANDSAFNSFVFICHTLLALNENVTGQQKFLLELSFKQNFLPRLWQMIIACTISSITGNRRLIEILQRGISMKEDDRQRFLPLLSVFCAMFSNLLLTVNDEEFYRDANLRRPSNEITLCFGKGQVPFSLREMSDVAAVLRDVALGLIELALPDARPTVNESYRETLIGMGLDLTPQNTVEWNRLFEAVVRLVILLHDRDERLQFCPIGHWCVKNRITLQNRKMFRRNRLENQRQLFGIARYLTRRELEDRKDTIMSASEMRTLTILRKIPFVVHFEERVMLLYQLTLHDQEEHGRAGAWTPGINLHVRRNYIYEDSYDKLAYEEAANLKRPLRIMMANWAGAEEAGIDGGGIFREFLSELLKTGFDPARGLFSTTHDQLLYPNPLARKIFPDTYRRHYHFLGRMLGKMIYENQLAEIPFAHFFLSKLLSRHSGDVDIHHLSSLDPILHKNLISLKYMDTNVADLYLDFTVVTEQFGEFIKIPLISNGDKINVTNENRLEYVQLMADFYLNKQIKEQTESFREGMSELLDLDWLQMFDYRELQILISGVDRSFDLADLRQNTKYSGEPTAEYVSMFWRVVEGFTDDQQRKLLKFVTGCSRAPLLGFKDLHPPFTIQVVPTEQRRLPTAATCMNLLKLPRFNDELALREKLSYAIESGAGFELS